MLIVVLLEMINIALLLTNTNVLDIIMNCSALVIVVEFDNILFDYATDGALLAKLLSDGELEINRDGKKRSLEKILKI